MRKVVERWRFKSSTGAGSYETLRYSDGTLSCSCPGWTRRAIRSCKHTRGIEANDMIGLTVLSHTSTPQFSPNAYVSPPQPETETTKAKAPPSTYSRRFT